MTARRLIAIVGPTAAGKTALGIDLAARFGAEILNADSRQVYRHMDIGTAKPRLEERAAAPHHLIDVVDPDGAFSLGQWLELAQGAADDIWSRGKLPLVVGGTGQYVWALLEGWRVPRVPPQPARRSELSRRPPEELLAELRRVDPEAERYIDPRNARRVIRALEVFEATGRPFTYWRTKQPPAFEWLIIGLRLPREELHRRIGERVDRMMEAGLLDEVRGLLEMGYSCGLPSMSGIGYKEMCEHLSGEIDLRTAVERTKISTHRFARRQNAWFKAGDERIRWIDALGETAAEAAAVAAEFLRWEGRPEAAGCKTGRRGGG
jgi:tRNA dimethylallyltransferase